MQERLGQIGDVWLSKGPRSSNWCRTWFDRNTRQTRRASLGTSDLQEAKLALWEWHAKYGRAGKELPEQLPLTMVLVRYFQQHASSQASAEFARIACGLWTEFWKDASVADLTPHRQREFMAWLQAGGKKTRSDGYIKRIMGVGKSALTRAYREGEITSVPFVIPGTDGPPRELVLSKKQSRDLWLAAERPHELMYLALAYGTLARPEAILSMQREFVDFDRWLLSQNPPSRKQTKKFRPVVPVCDFLRPLLLEAPDGALVSWRGKPIASFKTAWRALRARAGLPTEAVPKTIRHTMATELRAANVPEAEIQGMLGHRAYGGRTEVYAKYRPDYLGQATAVIDEYLTDMRVSCVSLKEKATR